jgi:hypothetical protein
VIQFPWNQSVAFLIYTTLLNDSPPLEFSRWYAGRSMIALMVPLAPVVYGFYVSLGGQPNIWQRVDNGKRNRTTSRRKCDETPSYIQRTINFSVET